MVIYVNVSPSDMREHSSLDSRSFVSLDQHFYLHFFYSCHVSTYWYFLYRYISFINIFHYNKLKKTMFILILVTEIHCHSHPFPGAVPSWCVGWWQHDPHCQGSWVPPPPTVRPEHHLFHFHDAAHQRIYLQNDKETVTCVLFSVPRPHNCIYFTNNILKAIINLIKSQWRPLLLIQTEQSPPARKGFDKVGKILSFTSTKSAFKSVSSCSILM